MVSVVSCSYLPLLPLFSSAASLLSTAMPFSSIHKPQETQALFIQLGLVKVRVRVKVKACKCPHKVMCL